MATILLEKPEVIETTIIGVTEIEETPETAESAGDDATCYLCPAEEATHTETRCYYCEKPICKEHNPGWMGWCLFLYDAYPDCAKKQTEQSNGNVNFAGIRTPRDHVTV